MSDRPNDKDFLEALISWSGLTASNVAKKAGLTPSTLTRPLNFPVKHRLSTPTMDKLRAAFPEFPGFAENYAVLSEVSDVRQSDPRADRFGDVSLPKVPVYGSAMAGEWDDLDSQIELTELDLSEVLDYVARPLALANDKNAYTVTILGESMFPRFRPGRRVYVSPRAPKAIGDDVVVQLFGKPDVDGNPRVVRVLIKELVRQTATHIELRQYNPPVDFKVEVGKVAHMHKVLGEVL